MPTLLIVEDETKLRKLLLRTLHDRPQWELAAVESAEEALEISESQTPDVILTDIRLPGMSGLDLIRACRKRQSATRFLVMTAYATVNTAVEALRAGAEDYLIKPFPNDELFHALDRIEREIRLTRENRVLKRRLEVYEDPGGLIGRSEPMNRLRLLISKVAPTTSTVLIRGESGTGKELIARAIHQQSGRSEEPLVRVNCGAIPDNLLESELFGHVKGAFTGATDRRIGRFESAGNGTILLDEIGEIPLPLQVKLLRVLQEREFEPVGSSDTRNTQARILAATNRNLEESIEKGEFREDLYYRLNVVSVESPPLRQKLSDLEELTRHFVRKISNREGVVEKEVTSEFLSALAGWDWPGNVRELENIVESALIMGDSDVLSVEDLPNYLRSGRPAIAETAGSPSPDGEINLEKASLDEVERHMIVMALRESGGNQTQAAKRLGVTRRALGYRREKYGL